MKRLRRSPSNNQSATENRSTAAVPSSPTKRVKASSPTANSNANIKVPPKLPSRISKLQDVDTTSSIQDPIGNSRQQIKTSSEDKQIEEMAQNDLNDLKSLLERIQLHNERKDDGNGMDLLSGDVPTQIPFLCTHLEPKTFFAKNPLTQRLFLPPVSEYTSDNSLAGVPSFIPAKDTALANRNILILLKWILVASEEKNSHGELDWDTTRDCIIGNNMCYASWEFIAEMVDLVINNFDWIKANKRRQSWRLKSEAIVLCSQQLEPHIFRYLISKVSDSIHSAIQERIVRALSERVKTWRTVVDLENSYVPTVNHINSLFGQNSSNQLLQNSAISKCDPEDAGVVLANGKFCWESKQHLQKELRDLLSQTSPETIIKGDLSKLLWAVFCKHPDFQEKVVTKEFISELHNFKDSELGKKYKSLTKKIHSTDLEQTASIENRSIDELIRQRSNWNIRCFMVGKHPIRQEAKCFLVKLNYPKTSVEFSYIKAVHNIKDRNEEALLEFAQTYVDYIDSSQDEGTTRASQVLRCLKYILPIPGTFRESDMITTFDVTGFLFLRSKYMKYHIGYAHFVNDFIRLAEVSREGFRMRKVKQQKNRMKYKSQMREQIDRALKSGLIKTSELEAEIKDAGGLEHWIENQMDQTGNVEELDDPRLNTFNKMWERQVVWTKRYISSDLANQTATKNALRMLQARKFEEDENKIGDDPLLDLSSLSRPLGDFSSNNETESMAENLSSESEDVAFTDSVSKGVQSVTVDDDVPRLREKDVVSRLFVIEMTAQMVQRPFKQGEFINRDSGLQTSYLYYILKLILEDLDVDQNVPDHIFLPANNLQKAGIPLMNKINWLCSLICSSKCEDNSGISFVPMSLKIDIIRNLFDVCSRILDYINNPVWNLSFGSRKSRDKIDPEVLMRRDADCMLNACQTIALLLNNIFHILVRLAYHFDDDPTCESNPRIVSGRTVSSIFKKKYLKITPKNVKSMFGLSKSGTINSLHFIAYEFVLLFQSHFHVSGKLLAAISLWEPILWLTLRELLYLRSHAQNQIFSHILGPIAKMIVSEIDKCLSFASTNDTFDGTNPNMPQYLDNPDANSVDSSQSNRNTQLNETDSSIGKEQFRSTQSIFGLNELSADASILRKGKDVDFSLLEDIFRIPTILSIPNEVLQKWDANLLQGCWSIPSTSSWAQECKILLSRHSFRWGLIIDVCALPSCEKTLGNFYDISPIWFPTPSKRNELKNSGRSLDALAIAICKAREYVLLQDKKFKIKEMGIEPGKTDKKLLKFIHKKLLNSKTNSN